MTPVGAVLNCTVGQNHDPGEKIHIFSSVDEAVRFFAAHEMGHAAGMTDCTDCIMNNPTNRGSCRDGGKLYDSFCATQKGQINAK